MNDEFDVNQQPNEFQQPNELQQSNGFQQPAADEQAQYSQQQAGQYGYAQQQGQYAYSQQQSQYGYQQQQQGQYGYQQQGQYGGYAQQQTYAAPTPPVASQKGKGGGWIVFLRVFLWIWFGVLCLAGVIAFIMNIRTASYVGHYSSSYATQYILIGIGSLLGCVLVAFVSVAGGMVALDAAANIKRTTNNSAEILELLQKRDR